MLRRLEDLTASMRQRSLRFEPRGDLLLEQRRGLETGLEPYGDGASDGGDDDPTSPDALLASFLGGGLRSASRIQGQRTFTLCLF